MEQGKICEFLTGVFAPVVTPFREDETVNFEALRRNIEKLSRTRLRGFLALGTNGEFRSLTYEEKLKVIETVLEVKGDKVLIGGASCESTFESKKLARDLARLGVDFVSLMPPSFFAKRMTDDALYEYFTEVAEAIDKPLLLYNNPAVANSLCLSPSLIARVSEHPNIFGLKDTSKGNYDAYIAASQGKNFSVLAGSADFVFPALLVGARGGVLSLANVFPDLCCDLVELGLKKDLENGLPLHRFVMKLNSLVSGRYGVSGVKAAMDCFGFEGGFPRRPLKPLTAKEREALEQDIRSLLAQIGRA
ncbi:MAG: dihydrodipicolinate synthase family protein [Candidatus Caldatribacterium sp.]|nr:dihydrodipicolinate synthase family protein [Candidatus Caldatribacterium sp.]